ncbi:PTS sugar transporter subunit IIA [Pectinatus sottacetonis]|uniref:PTS sugar transporter subunit IIA n=1 Tax=Pectinatus sottacetonis TaxID=1002795 RepID=UPI0018C68DD3|nr:PTS sugar transporter subunit IIA [Pectinatus sottacetonis]
MIGILVITHGSFSDGLKNAAELLAGKQEYFESIGFYHGDSIEILNEKVLSALKNLNRGQGILVFVDMLGGSPSNVILKLLRSNNFKAIAGANLPMICHAVLTRNSELCLDELFKQCIAVGKESLVSLNKVFDNMQENIENDF